MVHSVILCDKINLIVICLFAVQSKFDGIEDYKEWIMKSLGKKWKDYKCMLKRKFYEIYKTDEERIANCPETVIPEQWEKLVYFWSSPEGQVL